MATGKKMLIATEEDVFAEEVRSIISSNKAAVFGGVCRGMSELKASLEHTPVPIALVDIDPNPSGLLKELDRIVPLYPETRFAVASSTSGEEIILEAMQAGVRHFLHKKMLKTEIDKVLEHLLTGRVQTTLGSVITVLQASGGSGATTVSINLANELRLKSSDSVLIIDLDSRYGAVSSYLGITGEYGITDILKRKGPIDKNLITSSAANYMDDYDVLPSKVSIGHFSPKPHDYPHLIEALEACRQAYRYTIIDAPQISEEVARILVTVSKIILVTLQPTVKDVKTAKAIVSTLKGLGASPNEIIPLVTRYKKRGPIVHLEETKKALGLDSTCHIRSDFRRIVNSINRGEPLAEFAPRSGIRRDFQKLAETIYALKQNGNGQVRG